MEFELREADYQSGQIGLQLIVPVTVGVTDFNDSNEIGFSFGLSHPIRILGYDFKQGGIGFERSDDYEAIPLYANFPF